MKGIGLNCFFDIEKMPCIFSEEVIVGDEKYGCSFFYDETEPGRRNIVYAVFSYTAVKKCFYSFVISGENEGFSMAIEKAEYGLLYNLGAYTKYRQKFISTGDEERAAIKFFINQMVKKLFADHRVWINLDALLKNICAVLLPDETAIISRQSLIERAIEMIGHKGRLFIKEAFYELKFFRDGGDCPSQYISSLIEAIELFKEKNFDYQEDAHRAIASLQRQLEEQQTREARWKLNA